MMATNNQRGRNNNPEGRNQFSNGWMDSARERPLAAAAAVGGAVAAGVFLWSRRNQISDQLSSLSDQISDWSGSSGSDSEFETVGSDSQFSSSASGSSAPSGGSMGGASPSMSTPAQGSRGGKATGGSPTGGRN